MEIKGTFFLLPSASIPVISLSDCPTELGFLCAQDMRQNTWVWTAGQPQQKNKTGSEQKINL